MTVTIDSQTQVSAQSWRLQWSSDLPDPTYYIYRDGVLSEVGPAEDRTFFVGADSQVQIEILDDAGATPAEAFPGNAPISWEPVDGAVKYRIERREDPDWVEVQTLNATKWTTFQYQSPTLDDVTEHKFRVIPIDIGDIDGSAREFSFFMVRRPDRPLVTYTYDEGTAKITVAAL